MSDNNVIAKANTTYAVGGSCTIMLPDTLQPKDRVIICLVPKYNERQVPQYFVASVISKTGIVVIPSIDADGKPNTYNDILFVREKYDPNVPDSQSYDLKLGTTTTFKFIKIEKGEYWSTSTTVTITGDPKGTHSKETRTSMLKNSFEVSAIVVKEYTAKTYPPFNYISTSNIEMGTVVSHTTSIKVGDITQTYT